MIEMEQISDSILRTRNYFDKAKTRLNYERYETWANEMGDLVHYRIDGPAQSFWDQEGNIVQEGWLQFDEYHRLDGPARIQYTQLGTICEWYVCGSEIPQDWIIEYIADPMNMTEGEKILFKLTWDE